MVDPGFTIGGADLQHGRFSAKKYVKNERIGSHWGDAGGAPGSANVSCVQKKKKTSNNKSIIENWEHASEKVPFSVKLAM